MSRHSSSIPLKVYRGWVTQGEYVWSPFVVKLEARLRFAGISYDTGAGNPRSSPNGKIPYVEFPAAAAAAAEPTQMGDSTLIINYLIEQGTLPDLNANLLPQDKALDLTTRALLENKLAFYHTRERWIDNHYTMRDHVLSSIPWPLRILIGNLSYRNSKATLYGQGTLRFSDNEIWTFKNEIWETISHVLLSARSKSYSTINENSTKSGPVQSTVEPFWFLAGPSPTEVDATLFGFIVSVFLCTAGPESRKIVKQYPVLFEYAERIHDKYFPDYQRWGSF